MNRQAIKILSLALVLATSSSVAFAQKDMESPRDMFEWNGRIKGKVLQICEKSCTFAGFW